MNVKDIFKVTFLFFLISGGVILFQYLGTNKMDFLLIGLVSTLIFLVSFIFYESAIKKNKRLFLVLISLTLIYFALFAYKKFAIVEDKKLVTKLIEVTKNLREEKYNIEKLKIEEDTKKKDNSNKDVSERSKEIEEHNKKLSTEMDYVNDLYTENVKLLSEIKFKSVSKVTKIKIEKYINKYYSEEDSIKKNYNDLKKENTELREKIKNDKKREEEAKKKEEELKKTSNENDTKKNKIKSEKKK